MLRKIKASAAVLMLATPVFANDPVVQEVDVTFDQQAIESPAAAAFWSELEGDLEGAILARLVDQIGEDGAVVEVDIDEFDMSNTFQSALGADSSITADVAIRSEADPTINTYYDLTVLLRDTAEFVAGEDGAELAGLSLDEAYAAMITAFAANIASNLQ